MTSLLTKLKAAREAYHDGWPDNMKGAEFDCLAFNHILDLIQAYEVLREAAETQHEKWNQIGYCMAECSDLCLALDEADAILGGGE